ncbi:putative ABC transport system ATP-binding protein [Barrientosiimonas humi]|uniref:Putative ABC transport system ATP-binding protein n=1 Tax=Barrientosiimonas humi TaxID=999931 RepID=A0A542XE42_9MICO|nr:ABC transporter ATP-binding protein [Barrientosiimonas humi]TQL34102.1 putative ABC transport system ATP-binding protein [Barrientosiimonas humi]CAG7574092.1 putative ABC transporter ATP-binding protein YknY [Barrientosiimonas humi]
MNSLNSIWQARQGLDTASAGAPAYSTTMGGAPAYSTTTGATAGAPLLSVRGVGHAYGETTVLHGVSCDIPQGRAVALMGPSGSGKTTLLHLMAGILAPQQGSIVLAGDQSDLARLGIEDRAALRRSRFGLVFQSGQLLGELTAVENAALPLIVDGVAYADALGRASELFAPLGLGGLDARRPGELSGGQQQRVAIARAMVTRPQLLLADEPTGALDRRTGEEVMTLLLQAQRSLGASLVLVTHDPEIAQRCDLVLHLRDGRIVSASEGVLR